MLVWVGKEIPAFTGSKFLKFSGYRSNGRCIIFLVTTQYYSTILLPILAYFFTRFCQPKNYIILIRSNKSILEILSTYVMYKVSYDLGHVYTIIQKPRYPLYRIQTSLIFLQLPLGGARCLTNWSYCLQGCCKNIDVSMSNGSFDFPWTAYTDG